MRRLEFQAVRMPYEAPAVRAVPPHLLRAELLYKHPNGFYAGPNIEWMPQAFFADNANTLTR